MSQMDVKILQWLSIHAGLTSECVSEVIKPFIKWQVENAMTGMMWNEAAKHAATRQVMQPPPHPAKIVKPNSVIEQCIQAVHPAQSTG